MTSKKIFLVPLLGDVLAFLHLVSYYCVWRLTAPLTLWGSGLRPVRCETSTIWVPENKKEIVKQGLELLRSCDPDMYFSLSKKKRFLIFYIGDSKKNVRGPNGRVFGISEKYVRLGPQGIVMFLVQTLVLTETYPRFNLFRWKPERDSLRKVLNWMQHHSFHPVVINAYNRVVEKWEQTH